MLKKKFEVLKKWLDDSKPKKVTKKSNIRRGSPVANNRYFMVPKSNTDMFGPLLSTEQPLSEYLENKSNQKWGKWRTKSRVKWGSPSPREQANPVKVNYFEPSKTWRLNDDKQSPKLKSILKNPMSQPKHQALKIKVWSAVEAKYRYLLTKGMSKLKKNADEWRSLAYTKLLWILRIQRFKNLRKALVRWKTHKTINTVEICQSLSNLDKLLTIKLIESSFTKWMKHTTK